MLSFTFSLSNNECLQGPVTAGVFADPLEPPTFFYDGGVFESEDCGENTLNHFVLITGWGTDEAQLRFERH